MLFSFWEKQRIGIDAFTFVYGFCQRAERERESLCWSSKFLWLPDGTWLIIIYWHEHLPWLLTLTALGLGIRIYKLNLIK